VARRATTLLLPVVDKLVAQDDASRRIPKSAPIAQGIEQRFPKT
jgi:hypothetical protein